MHLPSCLFVWSILTLMFHTFVIEDPKLDICRFAHLYTQESILQNPEPFLASVIKWETHFIKEIGVQNTTGFTYDGYRIDVDEGILLKNGLHYWTASSKQSIHIGLMANALDKKSSLIYLADQVFELIDKKVKTLEQFYKSYPGFAGFLPWIYLNGSQPIPTHDFDHRVPALDNGEMFWAAVALSHAWSKTYSDHEPELRERWDNITWKMMIKNARAVFYNETKKKIRAIAQIYNVSKKVQDNSYSNDIQYYLDDPYEGELFIWILSLFPQSGFSEEQINMIWRDKRKKLQPVDYHIKNLGKNITVERGWWFSAHQQWKHLFMPYLDIPHYYEIMKNKEKARTWNSADNLHSGMFASVTGPALRNQDNMDYYSDCGIQNISFNEVHHTSMITPYSSFPLILVNRTMGAVWLHNMLYSPAAQSIYGATEATQIDGKAISPVLTWDSKITTVLAIIGGNTDLNRNFLKENGKYEKFYSIVEREYETQIPHISGKQIEYSLPKVTVRKGRPDFSNCKL